jgi:serine/threonine-protein kinase
VYAAGVVLWELLVGERLFKGENDGALILAVMLGAQQSPRQMNWSVPEPIDRACMCALRLDEGGRYPTALAFAEALEAAAAEAGVALASPRALAAFVKDLAAHKALAVPPMAEEAASVRTPHRAPSLPGITPEAARSSAVAAVVAVGTSAPAPRPPENDATSQIASVLSSSAAPPAKGASLAWLGLPAVAVALVAAGVALGSRLVAGGAAPPAAAAADASLAVAPATVASAAPAASAEPAVPASSAPATEPPKSPVGPITPVTMGGDPPNPPARPAAASARAGTGRPVAPAVPAVKPPRAAGGSEWKAQGL